MMRATIGGGGGGAFADIKWNIGLCYVMYLSQNT